MSIAFVDASAVMKLVLHEDGSDQLDEYLGGCSVVASDLAVTEVLRGARRAAAGEAEAFSRLVERTMMVMEEMVLITAETTLFARAGLLEGAHLRSAVVDRAPRAALGWFGFRAHQPLRVLHL